MIFSQQTRESFNLLSTVLVEMLSLQDPKLSISESTEYPLLVLETSDDAVGFAVVNGSPDRSIDSAYASFKRLYNQNHDSWKNQNLSFVVCRSDTNASYDKYFRTIEKDMYFCRKYVVQFDRDRDILKNELRRLPFTPLPVVIDRGIEIPPSAHTLLQRINVPALLANKIVSPGVCSAERLANELIAWDEELPDLQDSSIYEHYERPGAKDITRIKNVTIEAFRAYRRQQEFDLDADVVVLYGPNGYGKTSFFDAIDYACTGRIGRFCQRKISQNEFQKIARHLDAPTDKGFVSIQVDKGGDEFLLSRNIEDWSYAHIGDKKTDRASVIQILTSAEWSSKKPRVNKLEAIFRATHLFSQTGPELLSTFAEDSSLSFEIVSRMLAMDDYSSALGKLSDARIVLKKKSNQNQKVLLSLDAKGNEVFQKMESIPKTVDPVRAGDQLKGMASDLAELISSELEMMIDTADLSQAMVREWRSLVVAELENANENLLNLESIDRDFNTFSNNSSELKIINNEIAKAEDILKKHTDDLENAQQALKKLSSRQKRNQNILKQANLKLLALSELADLQEVTNTATSSIPKKRKELTRLSNERDLTNSEIIELMPTLEGLQIQAANVQDDFNVVLEQVREFTLIQEGIPTWKQEQESIVELLKTQKRTTLALEASDAKIKELKDEIKNREMEIRSCEKDLHDSTKNELALTRLLDEIETHVNDGNCPACGTKHSSKKALISKIHSQKQVRPDRVKALRNSHVELQNTLAKALDTLNTQEFEHAETKQELVEIVNALLDLRESVDAFDATARDADFIVNQKLSTMVAKKISDENTVLSGLKESLEIIETETADVKKQISSLERKRSRQDKERERINSEIEVLREQVVVAHTYLEEHALTLELNPDEITELVQETRLRKERASKRIEELAPQVEPSNQSVSELVIENDELRLRIEGQRKTASILDKAIGLYQKRAGGELESAEITLDAISEEKARVDKRVDRLGDLRERSLTLERALDSSLRSAMLEELEAETNSITKEKKKLNQTDDRIGTVLKWFSRVERALHKQTSNAIATYVDAFGPMTTLIQRRLRTVYGFGDIILNARGDEIHVSVRRNNDQYKPPNYFSDSQIQILMLSIFLACRITQTWSGFAPILMDDPVTHFDDLNDFGYIEFIRGVINTTPGDRQFIISTCEERLFNLMMKKFKGASGGAKFYKFEDISLDGPIVRQIRV